jgi:hypothetical protein
MQLGMIAANRVFDILDTEDQIQDTGIIEVSLKEISDLKKSVLDIFQMKR